MWPRRSDPERIGAGDLDQDAVLEASTLVVDAELADGVIVSLTLTDDGDDQGRLIDDPPLRRFPTAGRFHDGVTRGEVLTGGDVGEGSALMDGQLRGFQTDGDGVGSGEAHGIKSGGRWWGGVVPSHASNMAWGGVWCL